MSTANAWPVRSVDIPEGDITDPSPVPIQDPPPHQPAPGAPDSPPDKKAPGDEPGRKKKAAP
ncbi:hypothetical protein ABE493_16110 [Stenotrophomonas terrae]|uniref:hypothetical protein n=1 Tax=Stenotrophomonas terrae TaxID=405446 RepID=UPI00320918F9